MDCTIGHAVLENVLKYQSLAMELAIIALGKLHRMKTAHRIAEDCLHLSLSLVWCPAGDSKAHRITIQAQHQLMGMANI